MNLYLDEAGYTGSDLANRDQPVFVLASTNVSAADARELLDATFGADQRREIKHSRLARSRRGRSQVLEFIRLLDPTAGRFTFFALHKEYALLCYLLDFWLEPIMYRDGVNYYERGQNIAHANVCYLTLGTALGSDGRCELLRQFQVMTRDRTPFAYDSFWETLRDVVRRHELVAKVLDTLLFAEQRLGWRHLVDLPSDMLDSGDYGLLQTIEFWRAKFPGDTFALVHDQSRLLQDHRDRWEAIIDPNSPAATVGQDRRSVEFPLPVVGLRLDDSQVFPELQVADIIAGAAAVLLRARARGSSDEYATQLMDSGLLNAVGGGGWPSTAISPEELETDGPVLPDAAAFMGELIRRRGVTNQ